MSNFLRCSAWIILGCVLMVSSGSLGAAEGANMFVTVKSTTSGVVDIKPIPPNDFHIITKNVEDHFTAQVTVTPNYPYELKSSESFSMNLGATVGYNVVNSENSEDRAAGKITLFKVDVEIDEVKEDEEENIGAFVAHVLCDNGYDEPFCSNALKSVTIRCTPKNRPAHEEIELTFTTGHLLEKLPDGRIVAAQKKYLAKEIEDKTFILHGLDKSISARDYSIKAMHSVNTCEDVAKYTVVSAKIDVIPQNAPAEYLSMTEVRIGAGADSSVPAHCAEVTATLVPIAPPSPKTVTLPVRLMGGLSHEPGKEAELRLGGARVLGGDGSQYGSVLFNSTGVVTGTLTSSDVDRMACSIQVGATSKATLFTWDEVREEDEWITDPPFLPAFDVQNHTLTLRHHRDGYEEEPYAPFANHPSNQNVCGEDYVLGKRDVDDPLQHT